ncbi:MAG: OmpA family protein [Myxococcota bacterium]
MLSGEAARSTFIRRGRRVTCLLMAVLFIAGLTGCPKPPQKALSDAEQALLDASQVKDCASEKYEAARRLLEEAQKLSAEEKYDEAERKAKAARKLAREAEAEGEANWEDCQEQNKVAEKARGEDDSDEQDETPDENLELETVYFGYDSSDLSSSTRSQLDNNAEWIKEHPNTTIQLQGHTDERGTPEYNLALGEARARSVRQYLMKLGIDGSRLMTLSYGEEMPAAYGSSPEDFRKNRRVEFVPKD